MAIDNLPANKVKKVIKLMEYSRSPIGAQVIFLYPYSPDFNPIEKRIFANSRIPEL